MPQELSVPPKKPGPQEESDFSRMAVGMLEAAHRTLLMATDGLNDEQLFHQPSPEGNSIAWLAWHLSRWKDRFGSMVSGEVQVWVGEGWAERFGIEHDRTGLGDTLEQVAAFRAERSVLFGYVEAAQQATVRRVSALTPEQWKQPFQYMPTAEPRPTWRAFIGTAMDFTQHSGQIAYLRGLLTGKGWFPA